MRHVLFGQAGLPEGTQAHQRPRYGIEEPSILAITAREGLIAMILGLACVTMAIWADDAQVGATVDLQELAGQKVDIEPEKLGDRGESPRDLLWKYAEVVVEWGFKKGTENLAFDGSIESIHLLGRVGTVSPLPGDSVTEMAGEHTWTSPSSGGARRGVVVPVLYTDAVRGLGRTILTVRTSSGSFSFQPLDLTDGPILAPEHGFFVADASSGVAAKAFEKELASKNLKTIRQMVREHPEQTWEGAMRAIHGDIELPPFPDPPYEPRTSVDVPDEGLTSLWRIGAWQIIKNCPRIHRDDIHEVGRTGDVGDLPRVDPEDPEGVYVVRDNPFPPLALETDRILWALDHMGMHDVARDGISIWLENQQADGALYLNSEIETAHRAGALQLPWVMAEHARLTGDNEWLKEEAPRLKAAADWIIDRRRATMKEDLTPEELSRIEDGTWSPYGLQPRISVGDSDVEGSVYFYAADSSAHRSVRMLADAISEVDAEAGAELSMEAERYGRDLLPVVEESIVLSPVIKTLDGQYRSFLPQGFQDRGPRARSLPEGVDAFSHCGPFASDVTVTTEAIEAWLWGGLLTAEDPRIDGHHEVLEDVLLRDHPWLRKRKTDYDPKAHWFSNAGWCYQSGAERLPDFYLLADDIPNFLRSWLNHCAVDLNLKDWTFNEHTTFAENDKSTGYAVFLSNFRRMLVMEIDDTLWLGRGTPRAWLRHGKRIAVSNAPTYFGDVSYETVSAVENGEITATVNMPSRKPPEAVFVRFRHPESLPIKSVTVNGQPWSEFDMDREAIKLKGLAGTVTVVATY
jgi:hypothetical protein